MTKIKLCGLSRIEDIWAVNELLPDYIGYVFAEKSKRCITSWQAEVLSMALDDHITPVGVFVNSPLESIIALAKSGIIGMAQLHGNEDDDYIRQVQSKNIPVIKAFIIRSEADIKAADSSPADYVLLDSGKGSGEIFDHSLIKSISRPYFLAGGLTPENVGTAVDKLSPFAVDASSSLETDGIKDKTKMTAFVNAVRKGITP